ncbi:ArnT family glycosyltransferase [Devosia sp.]|uniref:ArnT family glycosyltransferase n=1 Tax=Devosia sp. TaxID=1871048 RepID=UPI003A957F89
MSEATATMPATSRYLGLKLTVVVLLAIKLVTLLSANLFSDEAYYWMWGQHPGLSYYDHPPLNGWLLGLSDLVFGNNLFGLRFWAIPTTIGTIAIFHSWARRYAGPEREAVFWRGLVIYLAAPAFGFYSVFATSDHLLLFFILLSAHFFVPFLLAERGGEKGQLTDLYAGAAFMGVSALAKYNAVFFGLALGFYIIASPRLRHLVRNPHLWLAALLVIIIASPVLIWNLQNGLVSFQYHLVTRHDAGFLQELTSRYLVQFGSVTALMLSPFLIWAMLRFLLRPGDHPYERTHWGLASWLFWLSTLSFVFIALTDQVFFWWNMAAYVLLMPFIGSYMRSRVLIGFHVGFGLLVAAFFVISSSIFPLLLLIDRPDPTRTRFYGWQDVAAPIQQAIDELRPDFVAAAKWEDASTAAFALDRPDIVAINPRINQYHYWFDAEAHAGENALVIVHDGREEGVVARSFETVTVYRELEITRFGRKLGTYRLYWGEGYIPRF